jgi:multidrug efflux pump
MYTLFARKAIPGENKAIAKEQPDEPALHPEYVAK